MFQFIATNTTSLKCLKVALDRSRPNDWRLLGQALARNTSIQTLEIVVHGYLHAQPLGHEAAVELFPFLAQNNSLRELTLRGEFSNSELEAFTDGLKHNRGVTKLYIACTSFSVVGLLGESLKCHPTVKELSLISAEVSAEQLQRFAEGLTTNQALTTLMWTLSLNSLRAILPLPSLDKNTVQVVNWTSSFSQPRSSLQRFVPSVSPQHFPDHSARVRTAELKWLHGPPATQQDHHDFVTERQFFPELVSGHQHRTRPE